MRNREDIARDMEELKLTAPKVTQEQIDALVTNVQYYVFPGSTVTVCLMTVRNGFTTVGQSACASPENFNKATGERYAYEDAKDQLWRLEGYLLRERLAGRIADPCGVMGDALHGV